jgi:hypothetical protein
MEENIDEVQKPTFITYVSNIIKEFCLTIILQTIIFTIFWNATVISIFSSDQYTINVITGFFAILAFKAITFSYTHLLIKSNTAMILYFMELEFLANRAKDSAIKSYIMDLLPEQEKNNKIDS